MKPFIILLSVFGISLITLKQIAGVWDYRLAGNIAMSVMLLFTALAHFVYTKGMEMMLPPFVLFKKGAVYVTGVIEIAAAIGLLIRFLQPITTILLIIFFIFILPCNVYAALKKIDYQKATYDGSGILYLWFRIPLQFFFIGWVYFFNMYLN
jgi:uncharacterized membrane protein